MINFKNKKMIKRLAIMAVLITGLTLAGTSLTNAQECIKRNDRKTDEEKYAKANIDCWVKKVKSGERQLEGAVLIRANLTKANLTGANLFYANLSGANLSGTNLTKANLKEADLTKANLSGANLTISNLTKANLTGANFDGADISAANLSGGYFKLVVRVPNMVCTMSDDEGPGNDADMGSFDIRVNNRSLYNWSGHVTTGAWYDWKVNKQIEIPINYVNTPVKIWARAVEMDDGNANETGENSIILLVERTTVGSTTKRNFSVSSSDFAYQINVEMQIVKSDDR